METTNSSDSWENALKHDGNLVIQCTSPNVELELLWRLTVRRVKDNRNANEANNENSSVVILTDTLTRLAVIYNYMKERSKGSEVNIKPVAWESTTASFLDKEWSTLANEVVIITARSFLIAWSHAIVKWATKSLLLLDQVDLAAGGGHTYSLLLKHYLSNLPKSTSVQVVGIAQYGSYHSNIVCKWLASTYSMKYIVLEEPSNHSTDSCKSSVSVISYDLPSALPLIHKNIGDVIAASSHKLLHYLQVRVQRAHAAILSCGVTPALRQFEKLVQYATRQAELISGADDDGLLGDAERASLEGATQLLKQIIDILSPMSKYSASSELNLELCNSGSVSPQLYHAMSKLQEWLLMRNEGDFAIILTQENNTSSVIADFLRESHLKLKVACITGRLNRRSPSISELYKQLQIPFDVIVTNYDQFPTVLWAVSSLRKGNCNMILCHDALPNLQKFLTVVKLYHVGDVIFFVTRKLEKWLRKKLDTASSTDSKPNYSVRKIERKQRRYSYPHVVSTANSNGKNGGALLVGGLLVDVVIRYIQEICMDSFHYSENNAFKRAFAIDRDTRSCTLTLPTPSPLRKIVVSSPEGTDYNQFYANRTPYTWLRQKASAMALHELLRLGELNYTLIPGKFVTPAELSAVRRSFSRKGQRQYVDIIPDTYAHDPLANLSDNESEQKIDVYLYHIAFDPSIQGRHSIGLLVFKPLPKVEQYPSFKIFPDIKVSEYTISVVPLKTLSITVDQLKQARLFHMDMFWKLRPESAKSPTPPNWDSNTLKNYVIVPLTSSSGSVEIDWDVIHYFGCSWDEQYRCAAPLVPEEVTNIDEVAIILSKPGFMSYLLGFGEREEKPKREYIPKDLRAISTDLFDSQPATEKEQEVDESSEEEKTIIVPVAKIRPLTIRHKSVLKPPTTAPSATPVKQRAFTDITLRFEHIFSPRLLIEASLIDLSFCKVLPVSVSFLTSLRYLGSILYTIESFILVAEFMNKMDLDLPLDLVRSALTLTSADHVTNLERLEAYGDCVLKYFTTLHIWITEKTNFCGKCLEERRQLLLTNAALFNIAQRLQLGDYAIVRPFRIELWALTAPGFERPPSNSTALTKQMADKAVADVVEALIGAGYVHKGLPGALNVLKLLGFNLTTNISPTFSVPLLPDLADKIALVESKLNYTFKNKAVIQQALLHITYESKHNICRYALCTGALAFIGDALHDLMLLERWLLLRFPTTSPGEYTVLRSAGTNHGAFAVISTMAGFINAIAHKSRKLEQRCKQYESLVNQLLNNENTRIQHIMTIGHPEPVSVVLESITGAVFVDLGFDFDATCKVMLPLMLPFWERFINSDVSCTYNPTKELLELACSKQCKALRFSMEWIHQLGLLVATFEVHGQRFSSAKYTQQHARNAAAWKALNKLKTANWAEFCTCPPKAS